MTLADEREAAVVCPTCNSAGSEKCKTKSGKNAYHWARASRILSVRRCGDETDLGCGVGCERGVSFWCEKEIGHSGDHAPEHSWTTDPESSDQKETK